MIRLPPSLSCLQSFPSIIFSSQVSLYSILSFFSLAFPPFFLDFSVSLDLRGIQSTREEERKTRKRRERERVRERERQIGGWGGESFVTPPTGKSCFVFVFALRACVRARATRREIIVYLGMSLSLLLLLLRRPLRPGTGSVWYLGMSLFRCCCCSGRCVAILQNCSEITC